MGVGWSSDGPRQPADLFLPVASLQEFYNLMLVPIERCWPRSWWHPSGVVIARRRASDIAPSERQLAWRGSLIPRILMLSLLPLMRRRVRSR